MVETRRRASRRLFALAAGLPMVEAVLIDVFAPASARALAPQASALGPFGVFHDLRWLLVYHSSWLLFSIELAAALLVRGALIAFFVRAAWPDGEDHPSARRMFARGLLFTAGTVVLLAPWAIIMFAQAVIPISWFFFAAIPPFLIIATLTHHGTVSSWLRRPTLRVVGMVLLSFFALSLGGAVVELLPAAPGVIAAGLVGLFNAYAWRSTVGGIVRRNSVRRTALVPAALIALLIVVIGGSAVGFAATAPGTTQRNTVADLGGTGKPVLVVKGFGGSYSGGKTYSFGPEFVVRRYSYAGLDHLGRPLPYGPEETAGSMTALTTIMDEQVRALNSATQQSVTIVAESEGSLIAERYIARPGVPVDQLIVLSPIVGPGAVYYPPRGQDGWGVASGWGLRGLASLMSAVSPLHFEADAPIVRTVVDEPATFRETCSMGSVARVEFLPLADALAGRVEGASAADVKVVTAFHGGLLGDRGVRTAIRSLLLKEPLTSSRSMRAIDTFVWAGAGAWRVPDLFPTLNPAWQATACP